MKGGSVTPLIILFAVCSVFTVFVGLPILVFFIGIFYAVLSSI